MSNLSGSEKFCSISLHFSMLDNTSLIHINNSEAAAYTSYPINKATFSNDPPSMMNDPYMHHNASGLEASDQVIYIPSKEFPIPTGVPTFDQLSPEGRLKQKCRFVTRNVFGLILDVCALYLIFYFIQQTINSLTFYSLDEYFVHWPLAGAFLILGIIIIPCSILFNQTKLITHTETGFPEPNLMLGAIICILLNIGNLALFWFGFHPISWGTTTNVYIIIQLIFIFIYIIELFFLKGPYVDMFQYKKALNQ